LDDTATLCNTLQYSATLCNTLQHTATHCNTPDAQKNWRSSSSRFPAGVVHAVVVAAYILVVAPDTRIVANARCVDYHARLLYICICIHIYVNIYDIHTSKYAYVYTHVYVHIYI